MGIENVFILYSGTLKFKPFVTYGTAVNDEMFGKVTNWKQLKPKSSEFMEQRLNI